MTVDLSREQGTVRKKWTGRTPVALLYPNTYPVAVSNLGMQLVYSLLNDIDEVVCERFVYPQTGGPLRSLESNRPLADFPVVCCSVSFEDDYPRLAALLAAGEIEPFAADRPDRIAPGSPLVILGGVALFMNPEPLATFADLVVVGEAEAVLGELMDQVLEGLATGAGRGELLLRTARTLPGCYVPSLYSFEYDTDGRLREIVPRPGVPARVRRVALEKTEVAAYSRLLSPEAELGMFMTELGRGCSRGCRFCAAGFIYRPPRRWDEETVLAGLGERPADIERVGLLGMEMTGGETLDRISLFLRESGCPLSFSSLRADRISDRLLSLLAESNLKSAAIAPDGCSERLRRVINKGLTEEDLLAAAERLVAAGIYNLKLYVMVGLPTETESDLAEMLELVDRLRERILPLGKKRRRVTQLTLSVNSFVPKPWTPFQFASFGGQEEKEAEQDRRAAGAILALRKKIGYLREGLARVPNLRFKADRPERVLAQAVFARGDRRLGPVLLDMGAGRLSLKKALAKHGLTPWEYAVRPRGMDELFCWEIVDHGIHREYLRREYERSIREKETEACDPSLCRRCGVCNEQVSA
ncbi:MAG: radical SAM protein [Desulfobulbaceae bacterium]